MTNAEKYLKEGIDLKEFSRNMFNYLVNRDEPLKIKIENFLEEDIKPKLTEDERVILRNLQPRPTDIARDIDGDLELRYEENNGIRYDTLPEYNHLFQFIKNGEEYPIKELLGDDK